MVRIILVVIRQETERRRGKLNGGGVRWLPEAVFWKLTVTMSLLHPWAGRFLLPVHVSITFGTWCAMTPADTSISWNCWANDFGTSPVNGLVMGSCMLHQGKQGQVLTCQGSSVLLQSVVQCMYFLSSKGTLSDSLQKGSCRSLLPLGLRESGPSSSLAAA